MYCDIINQYYQNKISEEEFQLHSLNCAYCKNLDYKINSTFSILDIKAQIPGNLAEKIISKKNHQFYRFSKRFDLSIITQIAAVIIAGVFLGIVLGKNSNSNILMGKDAKKHQSLIEYRESHHLNISPNLFQ